MTRHNAMDGRVTPPVFSLGGLYSYAPQYNATRILAMWQVTASGGSKTSLNVGGSQHYSSVTERTVMLVIGPAKASIFLHWGGWTQAAGGAEAQNA